MGGCDAGAGDEPGANPPPDADAPAASVPAAARAGELAIRGPWIRPVVLVPGDTVPVNSAAYFVVENGSSEPDRLLEVRSGVARRVELHRSVVEEGMARMRPADSVVVEAGDRTVLEPGGLHVMLIDVDQGLAEGDTIDLTLSFENAGDQQVTADVVPLGEEPAMEMGSEMDGMDMESES